MTETMKKTADHLLKTIFVFSLVHLFAFSLVACGGDDDDDSSSKKPDYIAANEEMELSDTGDNILSIRSNCKWRLYVDVDWLFLEPATGENNGKVTIMASSNKTGAVRSATMSSSVRRRHRKTVSCRCLVRTHCRSDWRLLHCL